MKYLTDLDEAALLIMNLVEGDLKIAIPLGLGKPNQLINKIYNHFKNNSKYRKLEIYTALSLDLPNVNSVLEKKLLKPFINRHFGPSYPQLEYVQDLKKRNPPKNIKVYEFYFQAGQYAKVQVAQQNYISLNYTHASRTLADRDVQVVIQLIAKSSQHKENPYSLSCNPDMTLDLVDLIRSRNKKVFVIGVVHPDLPYLGGEAARAESYFDVILESPEVTHELFSLPRNPVDAVDHMIGFHGSQIIRDDGTLQIGIGTLSDALVYSMIQRHENNTVYQRIASDFWLTHRLAQEIKIYSGVFAEGLYATSEMLMDGFMHLRKSGILKRFVYDQDEKKPRYLHAAFFLGSKVLYEWLRGLTGEDYLGLSMTRVSRVNDLYDSHELALRRQRKNARFFNTCMKVNLLGGAISDTLENGEVVSGVGGQFNFVAMSQELPDSHSVLMLRSTRTKKGKVYSNIIKETGQFTIPRHLRDVVVTEYGIAALHGKTDSEVIAALIEISDSRFQSELIRWAKKNGKLSQQYQVPADYRNNTPQKIADFVTKYQTENFFPEAPFGLDFNATEFKIIKALSALKEISKWSLIKVFVGGLVVSKSIYRLELESLNLFKAKTLSELGYRELVIAALRYSDKKQ